MHSHNALYDCLFMPFVFSFSASKLGLILGLQFYRYVPKGKSQNDLQAGLLCIRAKKSWCSSVAFVLVIWFIAPVIFPKES